MFLQEDTSPGGRFLKVEKGEEGGEDEGRWQGGKDLLRVTSMDVMGTL